MIGIHIDDETKQFSSVELNMYSVGVGTVLGMAGGHLNRMNRRSRRIDRISARRVHKERMAMIEAGMDPSKINSVQEQRLRYNAEGSQLRSKLRNENRADARKRAYDNLSDRRNVKLADKVNQRDLMRVNNDNYYQDKQSNRDAKYLDKQDKRKYKIVRKNS